MDLFEDHIPPEDFMEAIAEAKKYQDGLNSIELYNADPNCKHDVKSLWSGVKCRKCRGWYCA